jgi:uncharacterized repeat protein (TIGR03803 family)
MQQPTPVGGIVTPLRRARKPAVVYSFAGSPDGAEPYTGVIALTKRQAPKCPCLVGTTLKGGDSNNDGTVYSLTPGTKGSWTESVLYAFKGATTSDGSGTNRDMEAIRLYQPSLRHNACRGHLRRRRSR